MPEQRDDPYLASEPPPVREIMIVIHKFKAVEAGPISVFTHQPNDHDNNQQIKNRGSGPGVTSTLITRFHYLSIMDRLYRGSAGLAWIKREKAGRIFS